MELNKNNIFKEYPDAVDINIMCKMLGGISRQHAYKLIKSGQVPAVKMGNSYIIAKVNIIKYLLNEGEDKWMAS